MADTFVDRVVRALADCVIVIDSDQKILSMDAKFRRQLALSDDVDVIGETISIIWSLDRDTCDDAFEDAKREGYARLDPVYRHLPAQDSAQCWLISLVAEAEGFLLLGRDVTETYQSGRAVVESTGLGLWEIDDKTKIWSCSAQAYKLFGYSPEDVARCKPVAEIIHPADLHILKGAYKELAAGRSGDTIYRISHHPSGEERWIQSWAKPIHSVAGNLLRSVGAVMDITNSKRLEKEYQAIQEQWRLALEGGQMSVWSMDRGATFYTRSNTVQNHLGFEGERVEIADLIAKVHPEDRTDLLDFIEADYSERRTIEYRSIDAGAGVRWNLASGKRVERDGAPARLMGIAFDITDRKITEQKLEHAATHDILTGILNRDALQNVLATEIEKAKGFDGNVLLLLLDLDHFKDVNDTLGHEAGDAVLKSVARRIARIVGTKGVLGRLGGDEFAIVIPSRTHVKFESVSNRIHAALKRPMKFRNKRLDLKASIGVATFPDHGGSKTDLMKNADLALYTAKNAGRDATSVFSRSMLQVVEERVLLSRQFKDALAQGKIVPFYQPKIDLVSGSVIGLEALARWIHPQRGALTPAAFMSAFDDIDLALAIDDAIVRQVAIDAARWLSEGLAFGRVAINLSSFAFRSPNLVQRLVDILTQAGLPTSCFEIEVTETVFLDRRSDDVGALLKQFRAQGIKVSLDDFGTGYASLTHLKSFPVDEIKIDRSFVRDLETNTHDAAIVSALISLGKQLGMTIVAEGIETQGQAAALRELGCANGQGFLFAKPMATSRVPWILSQSYCKHIKRDERRAETFSSALRASRRKAHQS